MCSASTGTRMAMARNGSCGLSKWPRAERLVANLDLPASAMGLAGFSLHPDGTRFATSLGLWPSDIWMLEGFDRR